MPEFRKDPISGRWVIISTDRGSRPSEFLTHIQHNPNQDSPFSPGNEAQTPPEVLAFRLPETLPDTPGWSLRVVPNKYPAIHTNGDTKTGDMQSDEWFSNIPASGIHEVIIESTDVKEKFSTMDTGQIFDVLRAYQKRIRSIKQDTRWQYVQIFKNHGYLAGATLHHPHSQLMALPFIPQVVQTELDAAETHFRHHNRCIFCDLHQQELKNKDRVIIEGELFSVISAYAARFSYECWILPKAHLAHFELAGEKKLRELSIVLKDIIQRLDTLLSNPAYNMILHTAPLQSADTEHYHWHLEILPRLAFVAGFEQSSGVYINSTSPEHAAQQLREIVTKSLPLRGM
ncbi:MAG: galactose-1-phosphate uridylyltransferase [Calditrichaeota bacterium]|nr:galactose-1-phosphate uridylyltransferase [Calditrichota bacterium]MCB0267444.1 galactose-1-phosphate uridylyltransferase [Calditrichota bacterium]MCB0300658.1 galactose-1-phosphate uridylyltransferase [Calditrichota bacterium]MCB9068533.1 galactose-1-phosphate uridylyltransferase [Calditrichia bacterium]